MSGAQQQSRSAASQSPYAQLFRIPGAKAFCISGAVARLPISMMSLGIVLALNHMYDNWTVAGSMSAMYILAVAAVTPFYARLFDRFGQRRVGPVALGVQIVAMLAFALAALARVPIPVLFALAICMGLTQFSFGALVRTRWAYALRGSQHESLLNTAYALEAAIDEIVFIFGPILAAFLATSVHPVSQLFVPTLACGIGGAVFFSLKNTVPPVLEPIDVVAAEIPDAQSNAVTGQPAPALQTAGDHAAPTPSPEDNGFRLRRLHRPYSAKPRNVLTYRGILPLLVVFVVFNMSFTAFDVSMTATMKAAGAERFLGLQLAMFAVGSCIGAVIFGSREMKGSHWRHMVMFLTLLTCAHRRLCGVPHGDGQFPDPRRHGDPDRPVRLPAVRYRQPDRQGHRARALAHRRTVVGDHRRLGRHLVRVDHRRCRAGRIQSAHEHDDSVDRHPVRGAARPARLVPRPKTALTSVSHVPAVERDDAEARRRAVNNRLGIRPALVQARAGLST